MVLGGRLRVESNLDNLSTIHERRRRRRREREKREEEELNKSKKCQLDRYVHVELVSIKVTVYNMKMFNSDLGRLISVFRLLLLIACM